VPSNRLEIKRPIVAEEMSYRSLTFDLSLMELGR
jgi:hypothetical protein